MPLREDEKLFVPIPYKQKSSEAEKLKLRSNPTKDKKVKKMKKKKIESELNDKRFLIIIYFYFLSEKTKKKLVTKKSLDGKKRNVKKLDQIDPFGDILNKVDEYSEVLEGDTMVIKTKNIKFLLAYNKYGK